MNFLWFLIIGIAAGYFAGLIMKGGGFGVILNLVIGMIGGVLGGWLFGLFGVQGVGILGSLIMAVVGAIVLLWIVSLLQKRPRDN